MNIKEKISLLRLLFSYLEILVLQELYLEYVWECGNSCFSNNFSCRNACQ